MMNVRGTSLGTSVDMWSDDGGLSKVFKNLFDNFQVGQIDKNKLEWYISKISNYSISIRLKTFKIYKLLWISRKSSDCIIRYMMY